MSVVWCNRGAMDVYKKEDSATQDGHQFIHITVHRILAQQMFSHGILEEYVIHQVVQQTLILIGQNSVVAFMAAGVVGTGGVIGVREGHIPKD